LVHSWEMQVETALFFETVEQIYERVFSVLKPRTPVPTITVTFRKYANANSRIRLEGSQLTVDISDLLENAPAPIQEALAYILVGKLYRKQTEPSYVARYRRYLNRSDIRSTIHIIKRQRGRKAVRDPKGRHYDLNELFEALNFEYFDGLMARPELGWSLKNSRTTLGHYDPAHHTIVLSQLLDSAEAPALAVRYVMFHEMLHLKYPTEHKGSRRCVHTKEFKIAEKRFKNYPEALVQLRMFLEESYRRLKRPGTMPIV
jgi:SprT-like family protein